MTLIMGGRLNQVRGQSSGGVVVPLQGPSAELRAVEELRASIFDGRLRPGEAVSLALLADQHGCRATALPSRLAGLEDDGLLIVRGGVAMIRPLCPDEMGWAFRMVRQVGFDVAVRAFERVDPKVVDTVEAGFPLEADGADAEKRVHASWFGMADSVIVGALSSVERSALAPLLLTVRRHLAPLAISTAHPLVSEGLVRLREVVDCYRAGRIQAIKDALRRGLDGAEEFAYSQVEHLHDRQSDRELARILRFPAR